MIRGEQYRIQWGNDPTQFVGIYRGDRRGFHIFSNLEDTVEYHCRPSSVTVTRIYEDNHDKT